MHAGLFDALLDRLLHPRSCVARSNTSAHRNIERLCPAHATQEKLEGRTSKGSRSRLNSPITFEGDSENVCRTRNAQLRQEREEQMPSNPKKRACEHSCGTPNYRASRYFYRRTS